MATEPTEKNIHIPQRDGALTSLWQSTAAAPATNVNSRAVNHEWDVVVVGGGITGLTTALKLQESGSRCVLIEAQQLGFGTTGGTTAHINTLLDMPYDDITRNFGAEGAQLVAQATRTTIESVAENVMKYDISCDFSYQDGFLFAKDEGEAKKLESIFQASHTAGVEVDKVVNIPFPLRPEMAIAYKKQAQLHPLKYLYALARAFVAAGGEIIEHARVTNTKFINHTHHVETSAAGTIRANNLVYATHIPLGINLLHFRCAPYRSYVLAAEVAEEEYVDGLVYDLHQPYHYYRNYLSNGKRFLIIGGADHKTGHGEPQTAFRELEAHLRKHFDVRTVIHRWSAQFFESTDGLPYIGPLPGAKERTFVATGFGGNGITFGSFSALLLSDMILGNKNPYEHIFSPKRVKPIAGFSNFVTENADVAYRFVADRIQAEKLESLVELAPESGTVVRWGEQKIAIYKTQEGEVKALNPVCTHAGCIVAWNDAEKSWDCPCHGGRYDIDGHVLTGPPRQDLERIPLSGDR